MLLVTFVLTVIMMTLTRIHVVHFGQIKRAAEIKPKLTDNMTVAGKNDRTH